MSAILLDTHAAIWSAQGTLPPKVMRVIDAAASRRELLISPISAWEIALLVKKGRLALALSTDNFVRALFGSPGVVTAALTPHAAAAAAALPGAFHADPADRMLVATAETYAAALLTRDERILAYAKSTKFIATIAC